jgi:MOSC domain-containing protein
MGGEALDRVLLDRRGIVGDRWYAVEDGDGHFASGKDTRRFRRRDAVFAYSARTDPAGVVRVTRGRDEWNVDDSLLDQHLSTHMRTAVRVTAEASIPHQDMGAVSIIGTATLDWCAARWGGDSDSRGCASTSSPKRIGPLSRRSGKGPICISGPPCFVSSSACRAAA